MGRPAEVILTIRIRSCRGYHQKCKQLNIFGLVHWPITNIIHYSGWFYVQIQKTWVNPIWRILAVQLFQPMFRHQFRIQHTNIVNSLLIKRYALLHWQSADFLFMLFAVPKFSETFLQLGDVDYDCTIRNGIGNLSHTTTHSFRNQGHEKQEGRWRRRGWGWLKCK